MFDGPAVFVDIETNGRMGLEGRIIEIAAIRVEDGEISDTFQSLVQPGGSIPTWITKLTGISNADLRDAPYFEDIAEELKRVLEGAVFVAHNVRFDYSFIKAHFKQLDFEYRPKLFCTVRMSRALYPEHRGHSLEKIITRHNISTSSRHRAYDDAKAMYDFVQIATQEKGLEALQTNMRMQLRTKSLPPHVDEAMIAKLPDTPGIYIFSDRDGLPLYVGKSVNIRSRVRSHFTNDTRIVKEMKLSQRSYAIDFIKTDTEIEALLLESAKVKELRPLFNRRLRRTTKQTVLQKHTNEQDYSEVSVESTELDAVTNIDSIYGVYTSRQQAKSALERITKTYQLCPKLMSLEKTKGACFRFQLGLCAGACIGKESAGSYNERVEIALSRSKIESWPFRQKIAIRISDTKSLIVDQWIIESIIHHEFEPIEERFENGFDMDTYKILRSYVRTHPQSIVPYSQLSMPLD